MRYLTNGSNQFDLEEAVAWEQLGGLGADGKPQEFDYDGFPGRPTPPPTKPPTKPPAKPKPGGSFVDPLRQPKPAPIKPAPAPGTEAGYAIKPWQPPAVSGVTKAPTPPTKLPPSNCSNLLLQRCFLYEQHAMRAADAARVRKSGASPATIAASNRALTDIAHQIAVLSAQMAGCNQSQVAGGQAACPSIVRPLMAEVVDLPPLATVVDLPPVVTAPIVRPIMPAPVVPPIELRLPPVAPKAFDAPPKSPELGVRVAQETAAAAAHQKELTTALREVESSSAYRQEDRTALIQAELIRNRLKAVKAFQEGQSGFQDLRAKVVSAADEGLIRVNETLRDMAGDDVRTRAATWMLSDEDKFLIAQASEKASQDAQSGMSILFRGIADYDDANRKFVRGQMEYLKSMRKNGLISDRQHQKNMDELKKSEKSTVSARIEASLMKLMEAGRSTPEMPMTFEDAMKVAVGKHTKEVYGKELESLGLKLYGTTNNMHTFPDRKAEYVTEAQDISRRMSDLITKAAAEGAAKVLTQDANLRAGLSAVAAVKAEEAAWVQSQQSPKTRDFVSREDFRGLGAGMVKMYADAYAKGRRGKAAEEWVGIWVKEKIKQKKEQPWKEAAAVAGKATTKVSEKVSDWLKNWGK